MGYMDDSVVKNNIFMEFFEELKTKITEDRFATVIYNLGIDKNPKQYYKAFLTACLDDCKQVRYHSFSLLQKTFLNRTVGLYMWPVIKKVLPEKFKRQDKPKDEAIEDSLKAAGI